MPKGWSRAGYLRRNHISLTTRTRSLPLLLALTAVLLLVGTACAGVASPKGWARPVEVEGTLLVTLKPGKLAALDRDDFSLRWVFPTDTRDGEKLDPEAIYGAPVVVGDMVYFGGYDGKVYAVDMKPESGDQCANPSDDDGDGWVNEGCPQQGDRAERRGECARGNSTNDDTKDGVPDDDRINDGCPTPVARWVFETGDPVIGGLAYADGTLFVGSDNGKLYVLDAESGSPQQPPFDAGDGIWSTPLLAGQTLFVAAVNGKLYALDPQTLEPRWEKPFKADGGLLMDPILANQDTILVGGIDRILYALDPQSGRVKWSFEADNWFWGRPLVTDEVVYAPNLDKHLYALDLASGEPFWEEPFKVEASLRAAPVLADGVLVVADRDGRVYGLDPESGRPKWLAPTELGRTVLADPILLDGSVLILAQGGPLFLLDPATGAATPVEVKLP